MRNAAIILFNGMLIIMSHAWRKIPSDNVKRDDCRSSNGVRTCCSSLNHDDLSQSHHKNRDHLRHNKCSLTKKYIPSEYELMHYETSKEITALLHTNWNEGKTALINFLKSAKEVKATTVWLKRVRVRMLNKDKYLPINETLEDFQYLSRFKYTKSCSKNNKKETWNEWIEPLSIHTRDPGSIHRRLKLNRSEAIWADAESPDHVLVQNAYNLNKQNIGLLTKNYMFDAGCSQTFSTSTQWFVCAYAQLGILTDEIYSYEAILNDPNKWWSAVPSNWNHKLHYRNVPISGSNTSSDNPLLVLKQAVHEDDFVAFKLDVDTPSVEIPIALQLLEEKYINIIDEFFFELHYKCPIMGPCCWGNPEDQNGFILDNFNAIKLFRSYRERGIRAHFWP